MTPEQRIEGHLKPIEFIKEDVAWLKASGFSIGSGKRIEEGSNAALFERQEGNLRMYEGFIAKLKEQIE